jgi:hypothetical protein
MRSFIAAGASTGRFAIQGVVLVSAAIFLFAFLVRGLEVAPALSILVIMSAYASTKFRWGPTLIMAVGLTVFCVLVFLEGLGIPLDADHSQFAADRYVGAYDHDPLSVFVSGDLGFLRDRSI